MNIGVVHAQDDHETDGHQILPINPQKPDEEHLPEQEVRFKCTGIDMRVFQDETCQTQIKENRYFIIEADQQEKVCGITEGTFNSLYQCQGKVVLFDYYDKSDTECKISVAFEYYNLDVCQKSKIFDFYVMFIGTIEQYEVTNPVMEQEAKEKLDQMISEFNEIEVNEGPDETTSGAERVLQMGLLAILNMILVALI